MRDVRGGSVQCALCVCVVCVCTTANGNVAVFSSPSPPSPSSFPPSFLLPDVQRDLVFRIINDPSKAGQITGDMVSIEGK